MESLNFSLPIGLNVDGNYAKDVELIDVNGVAEKVILNKISDKPYTWQGNVIAVTTKSIGDIQIAAEARKSYLQDGAVTIPDAVKKLTLADVNTMLVEIHRRVWQSKIPKQEVICKYCGRHLVMDIDLDKIDYTEDAKEIIDAGVDYDTFDVKLPRGLKIPESKLTQKPEFAGITDLTFNHVIVRPPLLSDALRHEKYFSDSVGFWRRVTMDCIQGFYSDEGNSKEELPSEFLTWYNIKILNELLVRKDLHEIRRAILEYLPTLPFAYYEVCGCDQNQTIPVTMDASSFFSE